jgi:hypothetical protein
METLIFALIASYNAHRQKEPVVAEPEEFGRPSLGDPCWPRFFSRSLRSDPENKED